MCIERVSLVAIAALWSSLAHADFVHANRFGTNEDLFEPHTSCLSISEERDACDPLGHGLRLGTMDEIVQLRHDVWLRHVHKRRYAEIYHNARHDWLVQLISSPGLLRPRVPPPQTVPEPGALSLFGIGLIVLTYLLRKTQRSVSVCQ